VEIIPLLLFFISNSNLQTTLAIQSIKASQEKAITSTNFSGEISNILFSYRRLQT